MDALNTDGAGGSSPPPPPAPKPKPKPDVKPVEYVKG